MQGKKLEDFTEDFIESIFAIKPPCEPCILFGNKEALERYESLKDKLMKEMEEMEEKKKFPPPKFVWKKFKEEMPPPKTFGLYLLWNEDDGEGTLRSVHPQTAYHLSFPIWASQYTHWAFFKKKTKRDHYI